MPEMISLVYSNKWKQFWPVNSSTYLQNTRKTPTEIQGFVTFFFLKKKFVKVCIGFPLPFPLFFMSGTEKLSLSIEGKKAENEFA